jgi:hypothetical protein
VPRARRNAAPRPAEVLEAEASRGTKSIAGFSLDELSAKLTPFVDGSITTLGEAAVGGDKVAAKTIIEFMTTIAREGSGAEGNEVLDKIAEIRRAGRAS